jgi:predicted PurR-regulated permease PerM
MNEHPFKRDALIRIFFFGAFALILYQLFLLARPFFTAMLGAALLAMMFYPLHRRTLRFVRNDNVAALLTTFGVLLLAVLPLLGLVWYLVREAADLVPAAQIVLDELRNNDLSAIAAHLPGFLRHGIDYATAVFDRINIDMKQVVLDHAQAVGAEVTAWGTGALKNIFATLLNGIILSVALFFAFRDGERFLKWALSLVPMKEAHKRIVEKRVYETFRAVVIGSIVTAAVQGGTAIIGFLIAQVHLPVMLGIGTAMASLLGSSFLVTLPVALPVLHTRPAWGVFLLVWAVGIVGVLDSVLKPILIGSRAQMPFILIFFSIVGGIELYGLLGFILGPMLVASFLSFVKIYQEEYETE